MTMQLDDETLIAYVDGEVDQAEAARVETAMGADPLVADQVRALRAGATALRAAFGEPMRDDVPDRLIAAVNDGFAERAGRGPGGTTGGGPAGWFARQPVFTSMAASVAILVMGLAGAYVFAERHVEERLARLEAYRETDQRMIEAAIGLALEKNVSGMPANWSNPDSGSSGRVEPIRTFRNSGGQWCREYVLQAELRAGADRRESRRAIACREDDGRWMTRLELTSES